MKATVVRNKFPCIDWYCDNCNACLTDQPGFVDTCGSWTCTNCGYTNQINEEEIGYYPDYSPKTCDFTILCDDKEYFDNFFDACDRMVNAPTAEERQKAIDDRTELVKEQISLIHDFIENEKKK